jgi:hypothetical protein
MRPEDYYWSCPRDLALVAKGYQERRRSEWGQTIGILRALGQDVTLDDLEQKGTTRIRSAEEFHQFKSRFKNG